MGKEREGAWGESKWKRYRKNLINTFFFGFKKLSSAGGRLIIASDGIWDALSSEMAANSCRGLPAELAATQVVKVIFIPVSYHALA